MTELTLQEVSRLKLAGALAHHGFNSALKRIADDKLDEFDQQIKRLPLREQQKAIQRHLAFIESQKHDLAVHGKLMNALEGHPPDVQREALLRTEQMLLEGPLGKDPWEAQVAKFKELSGMSPVEFCAFLKKLALEAPLPPLTSALNVEVASMGCAHVLWSAMAHLAPRKEQIETAIELLSATNDPTVLRVKSTVIALLQHLNPSAVTDYVSFLRKWRESSYARLEVGHKLAASLCLTDIPDDLVVQHPWGAWSLIVPDGLLGDLARVWVSMPAHEEAVCFLIDRRGHQMTNVDPQLTKMVISLVGGCSLALSNPEDFRKDKQHRPTARSSKHRSGGAPDLGQARFMLSAPVSVDLREHVQQALSGKKGGGSPTVQFLVRGHWRQQAHGPARSLRKTLWIQPFWKGPEESRVLLRTYKAKGDE